MLQLLFICIHFTLAFAHTCQFVSFQLSHRTQWKWKNRKIMTLIPDFIIHQFSFFFILLSFSCRSMVHSWTCPEHTANCAHFFFLFRLSLPIWNKYFFKQTLAEKWQWNNNKSLRKMSQIVKPLSTFYDKTNWTFGNLKDSSCVPCAFRVFSK